MLMKFFDKIANFFSPKKVRQDRSFFVFAQTGDVIRAVEVLKKANFQVDVMGPPPWLRTGCDMVLVCASVAEPGIRQCLVEAKINIEQVLPVTPEMLSPVSLYQIRDLDDYFLVRAANMKITVEKKTGVIVNISGGGCPDVPYIAACLVGKNLDTCEEPAQNGQTLCSYALQKAFIEARSLWKTQTGS